MPTSEEKKKKWEKMRVRVEDFVDGLGMPMDKGAIEISTTLRMYGMNTDSSCEGHIGWGLPYPWVHIIESDSKEGKRSLLKMEKLLGEFYSKRRADHDVILFCGLIAIHHEGFRLMPIAGEIFETQSKKDKEDFLKRSQKEMESFASFLKLRFFR